jgi:omega-6 fatty acid desaturase (delta-12 desaturase)
MRKGKELILATKTYAKENRAQSWLYTISTLCLLVGSLASIYLVQPLLLKAFFSVLSGMLMVRFFVIYHDYQHHTILTKSPAARLIMTIFGLYILAPENIWKRSHDYHHANNSKLFTASIGSFPIVTKDKFQSLSRRQKAGYLFIRHPLTILMGYISMFMLGMCIKSFLSCPRRHIDSLLALILHFTASAAIVFFLGWSAWVFGMLLPFVIAHAFGAYLFYAQHNFPTVFFNDKEGWTYECAALESSSFMQMNVVMRWFTANIGYHHIHHLNAKIPFYRLPKVMEDFPELQHAKRTSLKIKDIYACLQLKVWDVKNKQMIGLRALK